MKKSCLLIISLLALTLSVTSCKHSAKKQCPVGEPEDYLTIRENNKKTEPYELSSGKAYYGYGKWSPVITTATEGTWWFETGDAPVTIQIAFKVYDEKTNGVDVTFWYKTDKDHYLKESPGTVTLPANTLCYFDYSSGQVILGADKKCVEFYIYCE